MCDRLDNKPIFLEDLSKLRIEVHIIGYKTEGECILFSVSNDSNHLYSGIVDFYENKDEELIRNFMEHLKINSLDFCCWTHPHLDHCKGYENIFLSDFLKSNAVFYLPDGVFKSNLEMINKSEKGLDLMQKINEYFTSKENTASLSVVKNEKIRTIGMKKFRGTFEEVDLYMEVLSPYSEIIRKNLEIGKAKPNSFSIGFILCFGEKFKIFLSGDIEDETIKLLDVETLRNVKIIKAPHHGSDGTAEIIKYLEQLDEKPYVVSTVYRKGTSNLPTPIMKSNYMKNSEKFICTGSLSKDVEENENFGIVSFYYTYNDNEIEYGKAGNTQIY